MTRRDEHGRTDHVTGTTVIAISLNGHPHSIQIQSHESLVTVLRNKLQHTGAKEACSQGECGSCAVLLDGLLVNSCLVPAFQANGKSIDTVEGLCNDDLGKALQKSFLDHGACQCGFCIPGMLMACKSIMGWPASTHASTIASALEGNLCRCTGYTAIKRACESLVHERGKSSSGRSN